MKRVSIEDYLNMVVTVKANNGINEEITLAVAITEVRYPWHDTKEDNTKAILSTIKQILTEGKHIRKIEADFVDERGIIVVYSLAEKEEGTN